MPESQPSTIPAATFTRTLLGIVAVAVVVRVLWLIFVPTQPVTDFDWYFERAWEWRTTGQYAVEGVPTAYWPVGYPAFLALLFWLLPATVTVARVVNVALVAVAIFSAGQLAFRWSGRERVAYLVAGLLAIHPAWIGYSGILASEPLYVALTLAGLAAWGTPRAGALLGLAVLVRPQALLVPVWAWLTERERVTRPVWLLAGLVLLPAAAWTARNAVVLGSPAFVSTNGGDNLLISAMGTGRYTPPQPLLPQVPAVPETKRDRSARQTAVGVIKRDPGAWLAKIPAKLYETFLNGRDAPYWAFQFEKGKLGDPGRTDYRSGFLVYRQVCDVAPYVLLGLAGLGLVWGRGEKRSAAIQILWIAALSVVFFGNPRFGFPAIPFLSYFAALALDRLIGAAKRDQ